MTAAAAILAEAERLMALGYSLVPTQADKHPLLEGWRLQRFTPEQTRAALQHPGAVGIAFQGGALNHGIVPVDFDAEAGLSWWQQECAAAGIDPDDFPTVQTPGKLHDGIRRPGLHRYVFDHRGELGNRRGALKGLGIDMRGKGCAVLPPSPHPDGGFYAWLPGRHFVDFSDGIPRCPDFLYRAVAKTPDGGSGGPDPSAGARRDAGPRMAHDASDARAYRYCRAALDNQRAAVARTIAGRNQALNDATLSLARLAHFGAFTEGEVLAAMAAASTENGWIAKDGRPAFEATFASAWTAGVARPQELPEEAPRPHANSIRRPSIEPWSAILAERPSGRRRGAVLRDFASYLLRRHVDPFAVLELARLWNAAQAVPPLADAELAAIIDAACVREAEQRERGAAA